MNSLSHLSVLVLDCQTTGSTPDSGNLLEIGWSVTTAAAFSPESAECGDCFLAGQPGPASVPHRIEKLTGIDTAEMDAAVPPSTIWQTLSETAHRTARRNGSETCLTLIHFARFETPFLHQLHLTAAPDTDFPLRILCTHQMAGRLLPDLPRLGLRALAGYLGYPVPEKKRCAPHVTATAVIWRHVVRQLRQRGIRTLEALLAWLDRTKPARQRGRAYPMDPGLRRNLPAGPGVYRMLRTNGDALYVGKAASVKKRVGSYFQKGRRHGEHILEMLTQAADIAVTPAESALQAAILESDEIKRLSPPYNIALKARARRPGFSSPGFGYFAEIPDGGHRLEPLPAADALAPFSALSQWLDLPDRPTPEGAMPYFKTIFGIGGAGFAPVETDRLIQGIDRFRLHHALGPGNGDTVWKLVRLGTRLWRMRLLEKKAAEMTGTADAAGSGDEEGKGAKAGNPNGWQPGDVVAVLGSLVRRSAHLLRRGRWLLLLSESVVAWQTRTTGDSEKHVLVFNRGCILHYERMPLCTPTPAPPGYTRSLGQRSGSFDLATYDRMRVLTTELRRLVSESRRVEIRLSPSVCLCRGKISRCFQWI